MLFHSINDPVMLVSTIKGSERKKSKILEQIPTTIEDISVRFKNKKTFELQGDAFTSLCKSEDEASSILSYRSDMSRSSSHSTLNDMSRSTSRSSSHHDLSSFFLPAKQDHGIPSRLWTNRGREDSLSKSEHHFRTTKDMTDDLSRSEHGARPKSSNKKNHLLSDALNS